MMMTATVMTVYGWAWWVDGDDGDDDDDDADDDDDDHDQPSEYRLTIYRYAIIVSFSKYH